MSNRVGHPLYGKRYCGNIDTKEVHDLDFETSQCQIDEVIAAGHTITFIPDTLEQAHLECYENCEYCIGRKIGLEKQDVVKNETSEISVSSKASKLAPSAKVNSSS